MFYFLNNVRTENNPIRANVIATITSCGKLSYITLQHVPVTKN